MTNAEYDYWEHEAITWRKRYASLQCGLWVAAVALSISFAANVILGTWWWFWIRYGGAGAGS